MSKSTYSEQVACVGILSTAFLLAGVAANAQSVPAPSTPINPGPPEAMATNLPGVTANLPPPVGFNALTASDAELRRFGFPPKPSGNASPQAYDLWLKAVSAPQTRIMPVLERTNIRNGPPRSASPNGDPLSSANREANVSTTSPTWSGALINDANNPFKIASVGANWVVPVARQAFGACDHNWHYSTQWVGIDGLYFTDGTGSKDVFQAGTEADASCSEGITSSFYAAWFEWYPGNSTRVKNFPVAPSDRCMSQSPMIPRRVPRLAEPLSSTTSRSGPLRRSIFARRLVQS